MVIYFYDKEGVLSEKMANRKSSEKCSPPGSCPKEDSNSFFQRTNCNIFLQKLLFWVLPGPRGSVIEHTARNRSLMMQNVSQLI